MVKDKYNSHIEKPKRHTTSRGGDYITPFDLVRSERGRVLVDRHADMANRTEQKVAKAVEIKPEKVG